MGDIVTVLKIGTGTDLDSFRPDTIVKTWRNIQEMETETTMTIEILEE